MRSVDEIYASLCGKFSEKSGVSIVEGGDMSLRLYAVAYELATLEANADFVARQAFPQTAVGEYLDFHAQMRGLERHAATFAQGTLRFFANEPAVVPLTIPEGTVCMSDAMEEFVTLHSSVIAIGETWCDAAARAKTAGKAGNATAGAVTVMELAPAGIEGVTNTAAFTGGGDAESDKELAERVVQSYRKLPNGANRAYYETKALGVDGVCAVKVFPKKRGVGTVDVVISGHGGMPSEETVAKVKELLEGEREICVDIAVSAPETVAVNVEAQLVIAQDADVQTALSLAEENLRGYFDGELLGKKIYVAKLAALLMGIEGVENCVITSPQQDITVTDVQIAVLDQMSITEAV